MTKVTQSIVGLRELRENLADYVKAIQGGATFTVVRRSKPIFNLSPVDVTTANETAWEAVVDFSTIKKGGVNIKEIIKRL